MVSFSKKNATLALLVGLIILVGTSKAQNNQDCCLSYTKRPLPRRVIKGFAEQLSSEVCDINAVIFITKNGLRACANPKDQWVKKHLQWLSIKLKKMSKLHNY
ncbi:C-C motif chemokine 20 [Anolis carolinensis]|uniref:C-C motif chemokine n=1 Tax=Anolis carolinensis TaxID=28377 RepID=R4G9F3_ANOCA|nr:PREDICTED: C-C motif chemokine 20 [Anolis carolinensis]|eukprot:XP_008104443.1 PREDICTED: C-C motif chemokine 20 [Anolis carolinensis]